MTITPPRITFVHAPSILYDQNYGTYFAPLWVYTLAAHVPENWSIAFHDCVLQGRTRVPPAEVFAFSGINQDLDSIRMAYEAIKAANPTALFIIGGPITWSLHEEGKIGLLDYFDHRFLLDGEQTLPDFLRAVERGESAAFPAHIVPATRFALQDAKPIHFGLITPEIGSYYGAVIEVSRGCPFLCEFCDIRVLPGNNKSSGKPIPIIVQELDEYYRLGISQFQFACDNFIGDKRWANDLVDAILAWKEQRRANISIFTWLSIDLYKMPKLMQKMRKAGLSILFIGIESVNHNSLLEAAKIQNTKALKEAVRTIQSYGFIIVPGFVFGFDSDTDTVFEDTLQFIADNGLIGGDPSFLMALPGTPLYRRMSLSGRLVNRDPVTIRKKIQTNIKYLHDTEFMANGFISFVETLTSARYQYQRFANHMEILASSRNLVELDDIGYGSPLNYLLLQINSWMNFKMLLFRLYYLLRQPANLLAVAKGWLLTKRLARRVKGVDIHFRYWLYAWTNIALRYYNLSKEDFLLSEVDKDFDVESYLEAAMQDRPTCDSMGAMADGNQKMALQSRYTRQALELLYKEKSDDFSGKKP